MSSVRYRCPPTCPKVREQLRAALAEAPWLADEFFPPKKNDVAVQYPPEVRVPVRPPVIPPKVPAVVPEEVPKVPIIKDEVVEPDVVEKIDVVKEIPERVIIPEEPEKIEVVDKRPVVPERIVDEVVEEIDLIEKPVTPVTPPLVTPPLVTPPVTPPVTPLVTPPVTPPITPPVTPPVIPPVTPPITPPVTPPVVTPLVTPPVTPPITPPITPLITPPVTPLVAPPDEVEVRPDLVEVDAVIERPVVPPDKVVDREEIDIVDEKVPVPDKIVDEVVPPRPIVKPEEEEPVLTDYEKFIEEEMDEALRVDREEPPDRVRPPKRKIRIRPEVACDDTCPLVQEQKERIEHKLRQHQRIVDHYYLRKGFNYFEDVCTCSLACMVYSLSRDPFVRSIFASFMMFAVGLKLCSELDAWEMPSSVS